MQGQRQPQGTGTELGWPRLAVSEESVSVLSFAPPTSLPCPGAPVIAKSALDLISILPLILSLPCPWELEVDLKPACPFNLTFPLQSFVGG